MAKDHCSTTSSVVATAESNTLTLQDAMEVDARAELVLSASSSSLPCTQPPIPTMRSVNAQKEDGSYAEYSTACSEYLHTISRKQKQKAQVPRKAGATKGKVRFAPADKIASITNRHNVASRDDFPQAWYQPQEYVHIKLGILTSIQAIGSFFSTTTEVVNDVKTATPAATTDDDGEQQQSSPESQTPPIAAVQTLDLSEHCLRGIETGISNEIYQRRKIRIHTTTQSVLEQQRIFRFLGVESDPHILRDVSTQCSHSAQESARAVALLDAEAGAHEPQKQQQQS